MRSSLTYVLVILPLLIHGQQVLIIENVTTNNCAVYAYSGGGILQMVAPMSRFELDYAVTNDNTQCPGSVALQQPMTQNSVADSTGAYYRPFASFPASSEVVGFYGHNPAPIFFESKLRVPSNGLSLAVTTSSVQLDYTAAWVAGVSVGLVWLGFGWKMRIAKRGLYHADV